MRLLPAQSCAGRVLVGHGWGLRAQDNVQFGSV